MIVKAYFEGNVLQRIISLLPNLLTSLNLFCGFYSIIATIESKFITAAAAIIIAGVFDGLDGRIARATNNTTRFGLEYDSMADLISFGLAPGLLIYYWALVPLEQVGWLASFLFTTCSALRLARFNIYSKLPNVGNNFFVGLPVPAAAGMVASAILFFIRVGLDPNTNSYMILFILYCLSFFMISNIKYTSFKHKEFIKNINFNILIIFIPISASIIIQPSISLFILGLSYVLSGPISTVFHIKNSKFNKTNLSNSFNQNR